MRLSLLTAAFLAGFLIALGLSGRSQNYVIGSGVAIHLDGAKHCNWFTKGIGIEHQVSDHWRLAAGYYDNSNCNDSLYLAGAWLPIHWGDFKLGTISGLVTGYRVSPLPAGGLVASYEPGKYGVNVIFIPPVGESGSGVIWIQGKIKWD